MKQMEKGGDAVDSIIGQFGVGFYSTFIVSDHVEVISKKQGERAVRWVSDGSGEYEVADADNIGFERGTRITLKLRGDARNFCKELEIEKILKKYS